MSLVDLSVVLNEQTPVYPGDSGPSIKRIGFEHGNEFHVLHFDNHTGTHIDAPSHMIKGGKTLDQFPVDRFIGRGVYIKTQDFDLSIVKKAGIQKDDIVLFHTGMSDKYHSEEYFRKFPAMNIEVAQYLVNKKVKMVGFDTCSADNHFTSFPVHNLLLKNDILIIENLANLGALENKNFTVYAFPLNLQLDGSPARVVAEVI